MLENGLQGPDLKMFTQADINARKLKYIHTQLGHTSDVMTFDVTNGKLVLNRPAEFLLKYTQ